MGGDDRALVAHIYPWWTPVLPLGGSAAPASVLPPATSLGGRTFYARRGRGAAGLLVFTLAASAVAAGLVALVA